MTLVSQRMDLVPSLFPVVLSPFVAQRDVTGRYKLSPGSYLIIPSTFNPHEESAFNLRVFTEKQHTLTEIDYEIRADENVFQESERSMRSSKEFVAHFARLSGKDKEIGPEELQRILTETTLKHAHLKTDGYSLETCKQLIELTDHSGNGKLQLEEFNQLWSKVKDWERIYIRYDKDRSGTMDVQEMRLALEAEGLHLNNQLVESLTGRYSDDLRRVDFDSFLSCMAFLVCLFKKCRHLDLNKNGVISMSKQKWDQLTSFK